MSEILVTPIFLQTGIIWVIVSTEVFTLVDKLPSVTLYFLVPLSFIDDGKDDLNTAAV